jgi:iron complex outermembrane recepter protein
VKYSFDSDATIAMTVNNIMNSRPPVDKTQSAFPYYNTYNYNSYGRAVWLEFGFHFGAKKN